MVSKGIQILHEASKAVALSTLGAGAAVLISGPYAGTTTAGFLMKKISGYCAIEFSADGATPDDFPLLVLAYGDNTVTEVQNALILEEVDPTDDHLVNQATVRRIVGAMGPTYGIHHENDANNAHQTWHFDLKKMDLPSKGLPFGEGVGWQWLIWNPTNSAYTTGALAHLWARYHGVWLSD